MKSTIRSRFKKQFVLVTVIMSCSIALMAQRNDERQFKFFRKNFLFTQEESNTRDVTSLRFDVPFKQRKLALRLKGEFQNKKEYWSSMPAVQLKSVTVTIYYSSISKKVKPKVL